MKPVEYANHLKAEYNLSSHAVELHSAYVAGAQSEYLDELQKVMFIHGTPLGNPQDPENPAEISWRVGWKVHEEYTRRHNITPSRERDFSLLASAVCLVQEPLRQVTGQYQDIKIPLLFRTVFPLEFANKSIIRYKTDTNKN
jgi:hypothetical protein